MAEIINKTDCKDNSKKDDESLTSKIETVINTLITSVEYLELNILLGSLFKHKNNIFDFIRTNLEPYIGFGGSQLLHMLTLLGSEKVIKYIIHTLNNSFKGAVPYILQLPELVKNIFTHEENKDKPIYELAHSNEIDFNYSSYDNVTITGEAAQPVFFE